MTNNYISPIVIQGIPIIALENGLIDIHVSTNNELFIFDENSQHKLCGIIDFSPTFVSIQPGETFIIKYNILHEENCVVNKTYNTQLKSSELNIDFIIVITQIEQYSDCRLCKLNNYNDLKRDCTSCNDTEIYPEIITDDISIFIYTLSLYSQDTFLLYDYINITVTGCQLRYGIDSSSSVAVCGECGHNTFNFDGISPCYSNCDEKHNGYQCLGGESIEVRFHYWISAISNNNNNNKLYPLYEIDSADSIISSICPPGYCCNDKNGCDYYSNYINYQNNKFSSLCAKGRDLSTALCSKCINGKYELIGTNECGKCNETNYIYIYFYL